MKVSKEFEMAIINDNVAIKNIDVVYDNGETTAGFVGEIKLLPFELAICKHVTQRGESSDIYLEFDKISSITLTYYSGEIKKFD